MLFFLRQRTAVGFECALDIIPRKTAPLECRNGFFDLFSIGNVTAQAFFEQSQHLRLIRREGLHSRFCGVAVYAAAVLLGEAAQAVLVAMSTLGSVSGRLEPIRSPEGFTAIVDYAHTPDAIANVLSAIHEVLNGKGKVITVCGAGGNRDHGKRPLMAQEAVRQSDKVILTSDNPRNEDPQAIIDDMQAGLDAQQRRKVITITDRREAIRTACMMAEKGDVVLVAGKGHETYQEINGVKHHFDDHEVLRDIFNVK